MTGTEMMIGIVGFAVVFVLGSIHERLTEIRNILKAERQSLSHKTEG